MELLESIRVTEFEGLWHARIPGLNAGAAPYEQGIGVYAIDKAGPEPSLEVCHLLAWTIFQTVRAEYAVRSGAFAGKA